MQNKQHKIGRKKNAVEVYSFEYLALKEAIVKGRAANAWAYVPYITNIFTAEGLVEREEYYKWFKATYSKLIQLPYLMQNQDKIPHITHMIYFSTSEEPKYMNNMSLNKCLKTTERLNAVDANFKHYFWTNDIKHVPEAILKLTNLEVHLINEFTGHDLWDSLNQKLNVVEAEKIILVQSSDIARIMILQKFGGIYHDLDYEIYKPFEIMKYTKAFHFFGGREQENANIYIGNAFIATIPNHPIINKAVELIDRNINSAKINNAPDYIKHPIDKIAKLLQESGPIMLSVAYAKANNKDNNIDMIFPKNVLFNADYAREATYSSSQEQVVEPFCEFSGIIVKIAGADVLEGEWQK